jgi:hypothetical protein
VGRNSKLGSRRLRWRSHLEGAFVDGFIEDWTRLALIATKTGVKSGRGVHGSEYVGALHGSKGVGALHGVATLGLSHQVGFLNAGTLSLSQWVDCLGTRALDDVKTLSLNQRVGSCSTGTLGWSLSKRVGSLSARSLHVDKTFSTSDWDSLSVHVWRSGHGAIGILENGQNLELGLTAVTDVLGRCSVVLSAPVDLLGLLLCGWAWGRRRLGSGVGLAIVKGSSAARLVATTTTVTATTEELGTHGRDCGNLAVFHGTTEELCGRCSKQVLDVWCLDVGLDDFTTGSFGVADDILALDSSREMVVTYYMPFHIWVMDPWSILPSTSGMTSS